MLPAVLVKATRGFAGGQNDREILMATRQRPPAPALVTSPPATGTRGASDAELRGLDAYRLNAYIPERLVEEMCDGRMLSRLLARKLGRKVVPRLLGKRDAESVVTSYGGIAVFDRPELHKGGMSFGQDFPRVLNELGVGRCSRLFEFCAGPGYIGYSLLAAGWCETLALADVSSDAVSAAARTAEYNGWGSAYRSTSRTRSTRFPRKSAGISSSRIRRTSFLTRRAPRTSRCSTRTGRSTDASTVREAPHGARRARGHGRERGRLRPTARWPFIRD